MMLRNVGFVAACALVLAVAGCPRADGTGRSPVIPTTATTDTAFVDVTVIPLDAERILPHVTVRVSGDRIVALGPPRQ